MQKLRKLYAKDSNFARLLIVFGIVFVLCSFLQPNLFLRKDTFLAVAKQFPEFGLLSIGIGLAMITGGIDLSAVSVANLSAIIAAKILISNVPKGSASGTVIGFILLSIVVAIVVGSVCGLFNGFLVSKIGIPAILATLGTQQLFLGIAIVITEGKSQSGLPLLFSTMGNKVIGGFLPVPFLLFAIAALIVSFLLSKTVFGAKVYMVGTNPKAASYAGINNAKILMQSYAISGVLASVSGLIMMARANSAKADFGSSYTLQGVLIAVLAGISPFGGKGNVKGIVVAVIILQFISTCLSMFENISNFYRDILWGLVLIFVLISNHYIQLRALKNQSQKAKKV